MKHRERRENIESVGDKKDFCSALKSAMADEAKAPGDYENLKSLTEDENVKNKIDGIISDEKRHYEILSVIEGNKELANEGSVAPIHTLEPVEIDKKKKKENSELNPSLVAIVLTEKLESDTIRKENSDIQILKGGIKMPEILENNKIEELAKPKAETDKEDAEELKVEPKAEDKADKKAEEDKEDKEEMSSDAILKQIKEMSADELVSYTNFVKAYLNENEAASAKEVTLAYGKSKADKKSEKELSASDLLASIDSRIASLKELDSSKKMTEMETKIQELSAKVKMPDRKTLSVAFESSQNSNVGMLGFLQHRIN